jgi:peptidoglycan/LPS O-acetylase OafA/YrhL
MGALRFFLAVVVATAHIGFFVFPDIPNAEFLFGISGGQAVMLFFVVSGFLMSLVLENKYAGTHGALRFYRARFLRIYPLWWGILVVLIAAGLVDHWLSRPLVDIAGTVVLAGADWLMAFSAYPTPGDILPGPVGVAWSLAVEISFYLLAPFALRNMSRALVLFVVSSALRAAVLWHATVGSPEWLCLAYYFSLTCLPFFLAGHLARKLWQAVAAPKWLGLAFLPLALVVIVTQARHAIDIEPFYVGAGLFALALPALFETTKDSRIMNALGDLTYPLYLTHSIPLQEPLIASARDFFAHWSVSQPMMIVTANIVLGTAFLLIAFAAGIFIEKPVGRCFTWLIDMTSTRVITALPSAHFS